MRPRAYITIAAVLALALLPSCGDDGTTGTGPPEYSRNTPEDVVEAVAYALEHKDIDIYSECLADVYLFEFLPDDYKAAGVFGHEPWWGKTQDVTAMDSMFSDTLVTLIETEFIVTEALLAEGNTLRVEISVKVTVEHEGGGDQTAYWAFMSWLDFTFVEDEFDDDLWQVSAIEEVSRPEIPVSPSATEASTFGNIKAMFRRLQGCELSPRSTPECLLRAFEAALEYKEINAYGECLSDAYLFEFTPMDAELIGLLPDAPWWGKTQDMTAMARMFEDPHVARIECALSIKYDPWITGDGITYRLEPDIRFTIDEGGDEEPVIYWVRNSWLDVEIVPDPYDSGKWVFERITEVPESEIATGSSPGSAKGGGYSTFGGVKAMFK